MMFFSIAFAQVARKSIRGASPGFPVQLVASAHFMRFS
jgi:hypothetical protein